VLYLLRILYLLYTIYYTI